MEEGPQFQGKWKMTSIQRLRKDDLNLLAKQKYTCVFVLRALSGPVCVRFLKALVKVNL
jgi:hypothetical protein